MVIVASSQQFSKHEFPNDVTDEGIVIDISFITIAKTRIPQRCNRIVLIIKSYFLRTITFPEYSISLTTREASFFSVLTQLAAIDHLTL